MAKKEMLISICDRCDKQVMTETASFAKNHIMLPVGWIHVAIKSRTVELVGMDLCDECGIPVLRAANKGDIK